MISKATRVEDYLAELPPDRRAALTVLREAILGALPTGYEEGMQYGMIGYYVPHRVYPRGYHANPAQPLPFLALASQSGHMSLYAMGVYLDPEVERWFRAAWTAAGHKLDMGKSCVRFKRLDQVPLEVVKALVARMPVERLIANYERGAGARSAGGRATKATPAKAEGRAKGRAPTAAEAMAPKAAKAKAPKAAKAKAPKAAKAKTTKAKARTAR